MEQSIETIWKEGFLERDALVVPKLNDLYNQKSKNIVAKIKRMMKINIYLILIFSVFIVALYAALGTPITGVFIFLLLMIVCWVSIKQGKGMKNIDASQNSYVYLKSFNEWIKTAMSNNTKVMRFFYPMIYLAALMPMVHALKSGEATNNAIMNSGFHLIYGIPTFAWGIALAIAVLFYVFGGKIYRWDVNMVYGSIFRKLESMIADMEELRG